MKELNIRIPLKIPQETAWIEAQGSEVRPKVLLIICILGGICLGYMLTNFPWKVTGIIVIAIATGLLAILKPEYLLYLYFFTLIIMTDVVNESMRVASSPFFIEDFKLKGLPPARITALLVFFLLYFVNLVIFQRKRSIVPVRYLFIFVGVLLVSLLNGMEDGWPFGAVKDDFYGLLFPVLCYYLCLNVLSDSKMVYRMIWTIFAACFLKCMILDAYYLVGRGVPLAGYLIVTNDSAVLMAAGIMILLCCGLVASKQVGKGKSLFLIILTIPMAFAIIFAFRRTHWIGQVASMVLLYLLSPRDQRKKLGVYASLMVLLFIPILYGITSVGSFHNAKEFNLLTRLFGSSEVEQDSNRHHYFETLQTLEDIMEKPLLGLGLGSSHTPVSRNLVDWDKEGQPLHVVHNTFIYLWMKTGLAGMLFLLWLGVKYFGRIIAYRKDSDHGKGEVYVLSMGSGIAIWLFMFWTGPVPVSFHATFLIALFAGMAVRLMKEERLAVAGVMDRQAMGKSKW